MLWLEIRWLLIFIESVIRIFGFSLFFFLSFSSCFSSWNNLVWCSQKYACRDSFAHNQISREKIHNSAVVIWYQFYAEPLYSEQYLDSTLRLQKDKKIKNKLSISSNCNHLPTHNIVVEKKNALSKNGVLNKNQSFFLCVMPM